MLFKMPRDPKDIFDTSAKIRAALENTGEGNGDSSDLNTSEDTDSLDESYLPSAQIYRCGCVDWGAG